jgi:hypothetical protein
MNKLARRECREVMQWCYNNPLKAGVANLKAFEKWMRSHVEKMCTTVLTEIGFRFAHTVCSQGTVLYKHAY